MHYIYIYNICISMLYNIYICIYIYIYKLYIIIITCGRIGQDGPWTNTSV